MNDAIVVDTSVVVKWLIDEDRTPNADALYLDATRTRTRLTAPSLLPSEVANAIYQRFRRRDIPAEEADRAIARFGHFGIEMAEQVALYQDAYAFTRAHELPTVYDSHYVVLAQSLEAEFWTDDQRLLNRIRQIAPWVRWIGDYPVNGTAGS
jgi:predicted nucleic acid-binding protein